MLPSSSGLALLPTPWLPLAAFGLCAQEGNKCLAASLLVPRMTFNISAFYGNGDNFLPQLSPTPCFRPWQLNLKCRHKSAHNQATIVMSRDGDRRPKKGQNTWRGFKSESRATRQFQSLIWSPRQGQVSRFEVESDPLWNLSITLKIDFAKCL